MRKKPVIFLAFANDRVDNTAYLRNLPKELQGIRKALERARQAGLCEIIERSNATVEQLLDIFQSSEYQGRIAIFHYGGHANGYQLLLESQDGSHAVAHKEGLISFLAKQRGLKMVFLNGCSSQQQALDLLEAGVPAVVGTSQSINDDVATDLAIRFYAGLGQGHALEKAWQEAVDEMKIRKGTANMRDLFWEGADDHNIDRFPWDIHFREGAEIVRDWNLPEAVDNPLFGLPPIPPRHHLPETPYLFLQRYQREQAEIFFGRSYYTRAMYNLVTDPKSPPLLLMYGQSGVGKSSLVEAGFKPRLEETHHIWYLRRDQGISIPELFEQANHMKWELLNMPEAPEEAPGASPVSAQAQQLNEFIGRLEMMNEQYQGQLPEEMAEMFARMKMELKASKDFYLLRQGEYRKHQKKSAGKKSAVDAYVAEQIQALPLLDQWLYIEEMTGKPLVIIVDQLESVFISPHPDHPNEFDDFCNDVRNLFSDPDRLPQGKLILSYRKEYHPEIDERFKEHQVPRSRLFIKYLERKDIEEVVMGLTLTERLRQKYQMEVDPQLPVVIADDLLEDKESPIAPVLQILLTKMWQMTAPDEHGIRKFTVTTYQQLRQEGLLMDDFYMQQMKKLRAWNSEVVDSGLALDLMTFHATSVMTADVRTREEVLQEYAENLDIIKPLLQKLTELFLLSSIQAGAELSKTTLAHDTLAPVIFKQYRTSDAPGQRARRILENKAENFNENDLETVLDASDLAIVEAGHYGMRAWKPQETRLVDLSRERRNKALRRKTRLRRIGMFGVVLIFALGILAALEAARARREKQEAQQQRKLADDSAVRAHDAEIKAQNEAKNAKKAQNKAQQAADQARKAEHEAELAAAQAREAEKRAQEEADIATKAKASAQQNLMLAQDKAIEAMRNARIARQKEDEAKRNAQTADSLNNLAQTKALALKAVQAMSGKEEKEVRGLLALKAYYDMERFGGNQQDKDVYDALRIAWDRLSATSSEIDAAQGEVELMGSMGPWFVTGGTEGKIKFWEIGENGMLQLVKQFVFCQDATCYAKNFSVSPENDKMVSSHTDKVIRVWKLDKTMASRNTGDLTVKRSIDLLGHEAASIGAFFYSNHEIASIDAKGNIFCWDTDKAILKPFAKYKVTGNVVASIKHPTDPVLVVAVAGQGLQRVNLTTGEVQNLIEQELFDTPVQVMHFNKDGTRLAVGMQSGQILLAKYDDNMGDVAEYYMNEWQAHNSGVTEIAFSEDGKLIASSSYDKLVHIYELQGIESSYSDPKPIIAIESSGWVKSLAFLDGGSRIIFGGNSRYMNIYSTDIDRLAKNIKGALKGLLAENARKEQVKAALEGFVKGRSDYDTILELPFQ